MKSLPSYVPVFGQVVARIGAQHGEPASLVLTPQLRIRRVSAVWFIGGDNYGMHLDGHPDGGTKPRIEAWGRCGPCSFVALVPAGGIVLAEHLELAARSVGLLP